MRDYVPFVSLIVGYLYLVHPTVPSTFLQVPQFHISLWMNKIPLCAHTTFSLLIGQKLESTVSGGGELQA